MDYAFSFTMFRVKVNILPFLYYFFVIVLIHVNFILCFALCRALYKIGTFIKTISNSCVINHRVSAIFYLGNKYYSEKTLSGCKG